MKKRYTITGSATQAEFDQLVRLNPQMYCLFNSTVYNDQGQRCQEMIVETKLDPAEVQSYFSPFTVVQGCRALGY